MDNHAVALWPLGSGIQLSVNTMWTSKWTRPLWAMIACIASSGLVAAADSVPRRRGLYDGAIGIQRNELADKSLARLNPETMQDVSFQQVLTRIEQMTGLQVWVDWTAFTDAGIGLDRETVISRWLAGDTVAQLTNHLADQNSTPLAWLVDERVVTLTTLERSQEIYVTRQYPIGDLLAKDRNLRSFIALLETSTSGPWDADEPGTGTLTPLGNQLFVRQTHRTHQEIAETLAALRREEEVILLNCSEGDLRLRRLLEETPVSFDWTEVTLGDFCQRLTEMTGARIRLDEQNLTDAGLDEQTHLDARAVDIPLFEALQRNLSNVHGTELTITVVDEECLVTTAEKASEIYRTVIYRVGSLGITGARIDNFVALLESETNGPWDADEPGTGTINVLESSSVLAIRQCDRVHREILEILRGLRPVSKAGPIARPNQPRNPLTHAHVDSSSQAAAATRSEQLSGELLADQKSESLRLHAPAVIALLLGCAIGYIVRKRDSGSGSG